jgi:hypothetical protein
MLTRESNIGAEELLRDQVHGLCESIFVAERGYKLAFAIGSYADQLNGANYGPAFGPIQVTLEQSVVLSVTKLFEQQHRRYPTRTIPATMALLRRSAKSLRVSERMGMLSRLSQAGIVVPRDCSDEEITNALVCGFDALLPNHHTLTGLQQVRRVDALRFRRDKVITHNESVSDAEFPQSNWGDIRQLLDLAKLFTDVVSTGYLGFYQTGDDGVFFLEQDAATAARAIERALNRLFSLE